MKPARIPSERANVGTAQDTGLRTTPARDATDMRDTIPEYRRVRGCVKPFGACEAGRVSACSFKAAADTTGALCAAGCLTCTLGWAAEAGEAVWCGSTPAANTPTRASTITSTIPTNTPTRTMGHLTLSHCRIVAHPISALLRR